MNTSIHYVLADSLTWFGVHVLLDKWFKQTLCVSHLTELISGSFGNGPVDKSRHFLLALLLGLLGDQYITNKGIESDTMC